MMKVLEILRKKLFWAVDVINGGHVQKAYNDIKETLENFEADSSKERRNRCLTDLLGHAVSTTDFYKKFSNYQSLKSFPVINKNIITENYNHFISEQYDRSKLYVVTTSGSTGTPFTIYQDKEKRDRHTADNIYFNELANTCIGSRLYYFRIWNELNIKNPIVSWGQNVLMLDASELTDKNLKSFILQLESDSSTKSLLAYASTLEAIGDYLFRQKGKRIGTNVNAILAMSETLPCHSQKILADYFSCPVVSRYSNMENGFIAQQCLDDNDEYHINCASFFVEMLDLEKDIPVQNGELGRIVVTDLFNFAMPLIRYDTGDIGIMQSKPKCSFSTPVFQKIEGRKVDFLFNTMGELLSPHVITNSMWKFPEIRQFQFIQHTATGYSLRLNYIETYYPGEKEIVAELKRYLGDDADIAVEYVTQIPILASGKRKKIINHIIEK